MLTYKVVEKEKPSWFKTVGDPAQTVEDWINEYAREGWTLDRILVGETTMLLGLDKDHFLLIFEKEVPEL